MGSAAEAGVPHIETLDMPKINVDGVVRDVLGNEYFFLNPPRSKQPPARPRKKRIESQFQDKHIVYCSRCNMVKHNRKTCKNPIID